MKEYQLNMVLEIDEGRTDEFINRLIALVESMSGYIGGGLVALPKGADDEQSQPEPLQDEPAD